MDKETALTPAEPSVYGKLLGTRLRAIRSQKGLSLQDVQEESNDYWKAAVVSSYERGERNISVVRLEELARFYGVPIAELLPSDEIPQPVVRPDRARIVLDLTGLDDLPHHERDTLTRFTEAIQLRRGDYNGRVLTLREDDLDNLALLYQESQDELASRLSEWGLLLNDN